MTLSAEALSNHLAVEGKELPKMTKSTPRACRIHRRQRLRKHPSLSVEVGLSGKTVSPGISGSLPCG
jgi:hypothetical protein